MALIGTENSIRCPHCGSIEFHEITIVKFSEALTIEKFREVIKHNASAPVRAKRLAYVCDICKEELK